MSYPVVQSISRNLTSLPRHLLRVSSSRYSTTTVFRCEHEVEEINNDRESYDAYSKEGTTFIPNAELVVNTEDVRYILGKGHKTRRFIQFMTGTRFVVANNDDQTKKLLLMGEDKDVEDASTLAKDIIQCAKTGARKGDVVEKVPVKQKVVGSLLGKNGGTKNLMQILSNCKIRVKESNQALGNDDHIVPLEIAGSEEDVQLAKQIVENFIKYNFRYGENFKAIAIPKEDVGNIIGKDGVRMKHIELLSHCAIRTVEIEEDFDKVEVRIYGDEKGIKIASELINTLLQRKKSME